jgi:hypothetical protein
MQVLQLFAELIALPQNAIRIKCYDFEWAYELCLDIIHRPVFYIEREKGEVVVVRDTTLVGGKENIIFCLKVPSHGPLALLIGVRYYFKVSVSCVRMEFRPTLGGLH